MHNISEDWKRPQGLADMNQICKIGPIIVTTLGDFYNQNMQQELPAGWPQYKNYISECLIILLYQALFYHNLNVQNVQVTNVTNDIK